MKNLFRISLIAVIITASTVLTTACPNGYLGGNPGGAEFVGSNETTATLVDPCYDSTFTMHYPANIFTANDSMSIYEILGAVSQPAAQYGQILSLTSTHPEQTSPTLGKTMRVAFYYRDKNNDGVVDGTSIQASNLRLTLVRHSGPGYVQYRTLATTLNPQDILTTPGYDHVVSANLDVLSDAGSPLFIAVTVVPVLAAVSDWQQYQ